MSPYRLDIPGYTTEKDLMAVWVVVAAVPDGGRILEVGAYLGRG